MGRFLLGLFFTLCLSANQVLLADDLVSDETALEGQTDMEESLNSLARDHDLWRCVGRDAGWEEHWGGHPADGFGYYDAYYRALHRCERYHRRCYVRCSRIR